MRFGTPYAEPFTFMAWRMLLVVTLLGIVAAAFRAPWPRGQDILHCIIAGLLVHACYLSGVLYAIRLGMPLGYVALIAGLQPILTAIIARIWLDERLAGKQWFGMALGISGVLLVVASKHVSGDVPLTALFCAGIGLVGITLGTLYQKRFCTAIDLRTGGVWQFSATGIVLTILAFAFESRDVSWTPQFIGALLWLVIALSIGAISLLYFMIRHGQTASVTSLFFLTPAVTAVMAWLLFGEALPLLAIAGLVTSACGVYLVMRK
jgi:drug/metabolite transporter (DMT)-like permease